MKLISLNGVQKERRVIPTLEVILLLQFFEQNMEKRVKMEMVYSTFLQLLKLLKPHQIHLLQIEKQIPYIRIMKLKNTFLLQKTDRFGKMIQ